MRVNQNIGALTSRGVDVNLGYLLPAGGAGFLNMSPVGTYLLESSLSDPVLDVDYDCAGYFGDVCGAPDRWRHRARISWETTFDTVFSLGWRYINSATNDDLSPDPDLWYPPEIEFDKINGIDHMPAYNYFDLSATYNYRRGIQLTAGINNIFDIEPPLGPGLYDVDLGPGFYGTYDPWGRFIYTSLRFDF